MRYDTFTIHAVGDYTSVESQETKKMQRHVVYALMPIIPAPVHDSCALVRSSKWPVPRSGPVPCDMPLDVACCTGHVLQSTNPSVCALTL